MDDIEKIKDRIAKLLAMAKDAGSPNEAAIAAQRARALMDKHQIEEHDLHPQGRAVFASSAVDKPYKYTPDWKDRLSVRVAKFNDCICRRVRSGEKRGFTQLSYFGHEQDVMIAKVMFQRLCEAVEAWCKRYMVSIGHGSYYMARIGDTYKKAMSDELCIRLREMQVERDAIEMNPGNSLVLFKMAAVEAQFGVAEYANRSRTGLRKNLDTDEQSRRAYNAGREDGKLVEIAPGLNDE